MMRNMNRFTYVIFSVVASLMMLVSCAEKLDPELEKVVGEWRYAGDDASEMWDVYIAFDKNCTFEVYQKLGDGAYRRFEGRYTVDGGILSGTYSDGYPMARDYKVSRSGSILTMTFVGEDVAYRYKKTTIPASVREHCKDMTRSSELSVERFL